MTLLTLMSEKLLLTTLSVLFGLNYESYGLPSCAFCRFVLIVKISQTHKKLRNIKKFLIKYLKTLAKNIFTGFTPINMKIIAFKNGKDKYKLLCKLEP